MLQAGGPGNLDEVHDGGLGEAETGGLLAGTEIADGGGDLPVLRLAGSDDADACAESVAIVLASLQIDGEPVVALAEGVAEKEGRGAEAGDDGVDAAVAVEISEGGAAMMRAAERLARVGKRAEAIVDKGRKAAVRAKELRLVIKRA